MTPNGNGKGYHEALEKFINSEDLKIPSRESLFLIIKELDEIYDPERKIFDSQKEYRKKSVSRNLITKGFCDLPFDYNGILLAEQMKELGYIVKMELDRIKISVF